MLFSRLFLFVGIVKICPPTPSRRMQPPSTPKHSALCLCRWCILTAAAFQRVLPVILWSLINPLLYLRSLLTKTCVWGTRAHGLWAILHGAVRGGQTAEAHAALSSSRVAALIIRMICKRIKSIKIPPSVSSCCMGSKVRSFWDIPDQTKGKMHKRVNSIHKWLF